MIPPLNVGKCAIEQNQYVACSDRSDYIKYAHTLHLPQEDTLDPTLIPGQQSLERFQIVPSDNHVLALFGVVCILLLQHPVGDFQVVVDYLVFSDPFKYRHLCSLL